MTTNPPVRVGDRIVALDVPFLNELKGKEAIVTCVNATTVNAEFPRDDHPDPPYVTSWRLADPEPYRPEKGDRVRVVLEGEVTMPREDGCYVGVPATSFVHNKSIVSIERLPDPEPKWQPGDVVRDGNGNTWHRPPVDHGDVWHLVYVHHVVAESEMEDKQMGHRMARPLTLLVRDGKPVGGAA